MEYFDFDQAAQHEQAQDERGFICFDEESQFGVESNAPELGDFNFDNIDVDLPLDGAEPAVNAKGVDMGHDEEPRFDDFSRWIPRYVKPPFPCDYCRSRHLECFVRDEGKLGCSSCITLFRACSFVRPEQEHPAGEEDGRGGINTLHGVAEDVVVDAGPTGTRALSSTETSRKTGPRFSRDAVRILKNWIREHSDHPYPTDNEKDELKRATGLARSQVCNWLANARRRGKVVPQRPASPSFNVSSYRGAIDIGNPIASEAARQNMNPLERWKHSPPEHEPASIPAIANAVARSTYSSDQDVSSSASSWADHYKESTTSGSSFSAFRAPSLTSLDTGRSSGSDFSFGSAFSHPSQHSYGSIEKLKQQRRRRRRTNLPRPADSKARMFQCTFCTDTFKTKHDWQRHEKSLHLSIETWTCAPLGGTIQLPSGPVCAFCNAANPSREHLNGHNYDICCEKTERERTFYRKDHLRQHLRLTHDCDFNAHIMDSWKSTALSLRSRCGFCGEMMNCWLWRTDHLASHFRAGAQMGDWKGDWGFEPHILALLENAMPPWMIARERRTSIPFSATKTPASPSLQTQQQRAAVGLDELNRKMQMDRGFVPNDTMCYKRFEENLAAWVKEQRARAITPSDADLAYHGRMILYGAADDWDDSPVDDPDWLYLFKKTYGLAGDPAVGDGDGGGGGGGGGGNGAIDAPAGTVKHADGMGVSGVNGWSNLAAVGGCSPDPSTLMLGKGIEGLGLETG